MKRMLKRTLSLILAMIMVMGVLPMNTMAAMIMGDPDGGRLETPVIDRSDPIVDTHAVSVSGGHERPEVPPDESEEPANPLWTNDTVTATINPDGTWTVKMSTVDAATGSASNAWGVALVPNVSRGEGSTTADKLAPTLHGGNVGTYSGLANTIMGATGLADDEFVIVGGGLSASLTTDADGFFTVTSTDTGKMMPDVSTLATRFGVSAPIDVTVIFFTKGSGGTSTHVKYTATTYGEPSKGLPHTIYVLNTKQETLIYVGGTLEGSSWSPSEDVVPGTTLVGGDAVSGYGSWDGAGALDIPIYNVTDELVNMEYPPQTLPDGVDAATGPSSIAANGEGTAKFTIPDGFESGTIVMPIVGTGEDVYTGSITVYVDNGVFPVTADPIDFYITQGDKSMEDTPLEAVITFHYPSSYITYNPDSDGEGNPAFMTVGTSEEDGEVTLCLFDISEDGTGDYGFSFGTPDYSLSTKYEVSYFEDFEFEAIDLCNTPFTIVLNTYDPAFDATSLKDGDVLTTYIKIPGIAEVLTNTLGPEDLAVPIRIHVAVPPKDSYTVKYDTNEGGKDLTPSVASGSLADVTDKYAGDTVKVPTISDNKGHYEFKGWALADDATSAAYDASNDYTVDAGDADADGVITLYAVWEEITYTVTYSWGGYTPVPSKNVPTETAKMKDAVVTVDTTVTTATEATNGGLYYTFKEWKVTTPASGTTIASGKFTMPGENVTLTAQWEPVMLSVTYVLDGGTAGTNAGTGTVQKGADYTIDADNPTKTGYTFGGWKLTAGTATTATGTVLNKNGKVQGVTANITLTAQWTPEKRKVSYDLVKTFNASVLATPADTSVDYDTTATLTTVPSQNYEDTSGKGWTFKGWSATSGGTTAITKIDNLKTDTTVYAIWEPTEYTVTFYPNATGATVDGGASKAVTVQHGDTVSTLPTAARTGYTFDKWTIGSAATGTTFTTSYVVKSDLSVYAQWNVDHYKVNFHYNGKGGTDTTETTEVGTNTALKTPSTVTGYTFGGWYTDSALTTQQTGAVSGTGRADGDEVDLYAMWTANEHTIIYHVNGPSGGSISSTDSPVTFHYGDTGVTAKAGTIIGGTITGWNFVKWNTAANGSGTDYNAGDTLPTATTDANINLYAQWTVDVTFDLNATSVTPNATGLSAVPAVQKVAVNTGHATKPATDPTASNWTFDKWVIGSGTTAVNFATQTFTGPTTIKATWKAKDTDAIFDLNYSGAAAPTTLTGTPGSNVTTGIPSTTRTGWRFDGWYTGKTDGTKVTTPTFPAAGNSAVTYYAHWTQLFTVSYDMKSHGTNPGAHTNVPDGTKVTTKSVSNVTGYTFKGWDTNSAGTTVVYAAGTETAAITADTTLYAVWEVNAHTITYNKNNGPADAVVPGVVNTTYGASETVGTATTSTAGWTFMGWSRSSGNQTVSDAAGSSITMGDANITLYAQWNIAISFDIHDPQTPSTLSNPSPKTTTVGGTITLPAQTDLTDYTFLGWFTEATGGTKKGSTDTYSVPTTLHAQWEAKTYTYTFNPNNGTFPNGTTNTSTTGGVGTTIPAPSNNPTRTNYTFLGWGTASTSTTADATVATTMPSGGGTVYAVWKANTYGYVFDPNEGAFANGETGLQGDGTVKLTGAAGATVTAPADPTRAKYKFDGWYTGKTDGTKVTTHTITGNAADGAVTNTVYAHWIPLYDVTYDAGGHGTVDTSKNDLNKAARTYSVLGGSEVITTGGTWSGDYFTDTAGKHWKFNGWKASSDNSKLYSKGNNLTVNQDVTLTAQWDEYYLVTLAPPVLTDTTTALGDHVTVKLGGSLKDSSHTEGNRQVWVKKNDSLDIAELALKTNANNYIFAKWTATASTGAFGTDGATAQATAYTPTADTTLTPNYWRKPTLTDKDSYHQNFATDATVANDKWGSATKKKGTNTLPAYTWTKNSATLTSTDTLQIELTSGNWTTLNVADAAGAGVDVVKSTDANGNVTYTFQRDYLMTLVVPMGDTCKPFNIRVQSNTPDTTTTNHTATPLTAVLEIAVNPDPLTEVNIQVEDTASATANVGVTTRDSVIYKDHKSTTITKTNELTYTWYVSNGATTPTQKSYSTSLAGHAASVTGAKNDAAALGTVIGTADTTNDFVNLTAAHKGKYIYAVVAATNTGYGAVITNAIAVDYDAVVKVTKDTNTSITGANYTVYLVPQPTTGSNAVGYAAANLPASKVQAAYQSGNEYKTADSALTGGVTYDIYVNKVEGDATYFVKTGKTVSTQTASAAAQTLEFFSVNAVETKVNDAKDSNNKPVGEAFNTGDVPDIVLTTSDVTAPITSGNGVFKGSVVTAKTDSDSWPQDYNVDWGKATTTLPAAGLTYTTTTDQTKAQAKATGTTGHTINAKTWIGARLDQNLYTVTGNIWANNNTAGIVANSAKLTFGEYEFTGTSTNGTKGQNVTFSAKVPRSSAATGSAITGKYSITAEPKTSPLSTILGYVEWQATTATEATINTALTSKRLDGTDKNTLKTDITANNNQAFTIVVAASTYILTIPEVSGVHAKATQDWSTNTAAAPTTAASTTASWTVDYAYTGEGTYTFKVVNDGNTTLDVALNVAKSKAATAADNGYVYGDSTNVTNKLVAGANAGEMKDPVTNVVFTGLATSFPALAPGQEKTFTVKIPTALAVNGTADYAFEFTSTETNKTGVYGPSVTYKLTQKINPLKITDIQAKSTGTNTWAPDALAIDSKTGTNIPAGVTVANEVEYKWYVAPKGNAVSLSTTGVGALTGTGMVEAAGAQSDGTYQLAAADQGMSLYLLARNKGTGNIIEADYVKVADLPYDLNIIVRENTTDVLVANKGNYKVYLRPSTATGDFATTETGVVEATADTTTAGIYTASNLVSGTTYKVYTNAVGGTTNANWQDSGVTVSLSDFGKDPKVVTYRNVILSNTTVSNQRYNAAITADTTDFLATYTGSAPYDTARTDTLKAPTAKVGTTDVATSDVNKWVQSGTTVNLTYPAWTKDYTLTWTGATQATNNKATGSTASKQVTAADTTIQTALELNLYTVTLTVDGPGTLSEVKMNDGTRDFTATAGNLHATGSATPPIGKGSYTFTVPAGTYTVLGTGSAGTDILYYKIPASSTTEIEPGNIGTHSITVADNTSSFHIQLNSVGQYMLVEDDQKPVDNTTITAHNAGTAGWTGTAKTDGIGGSTIHLPYGYTAARSVTVTVANNSAENNHLYNLTWTPAATGNSASITASAGNLDGSKNILYPYGGTVEDPLTATLTVATGLAVGTHTYTADVTFNTADGDATNQPKVTYTLTVVVDPAEFTAVSITKASSSPAADIGNGTMVEFGESLLPYQYATTIPDLWEDKGITAGTDYTYIWYATPADKTLTGSWAAGVFTPAAGSSATELTPKTGTYELEGSTIANYPGQKIWLVVSASKAKGDGTNVIEYAISNPVTTGFQPVVKIAVDHVDQSTIADFDGTGYTATITDGATTWQTKWSDAKGGFVPVDATDNTTEISLPTGTYTASVGRAKGDTTLVALPNTDTMTLASPAVTAKYFTVNAVKTKAFEAISGLGETTFGGDDNNEGPAPVFTLGGNALADKTPVLKDQSVNAAIAAGDKWTEDYKLTWYSKLDNNTTGTNTAPTFANAYEGTTPTMSAWGGGKQDVDAAATTGYQNVAVSETLYIGGRLDQNTYTITGKVVGATGTVTGVKVEQIGADDSVVTTYVWPDNHSDKTNTGIGDGNHDGALQNNETVTFTVVKGDYTITSTPNGSTVIESVQWESDAAVDGNVLTKKNVAALSATNTKTAYNFVINVVGSSLSLTANEIVSNTVVTSGQNEYKNGTNTVVRYFNYIDKKNTDSTAGDVTSFPVVLENGGNMDLTVGLDVFYFDTTAKSQLNDTYYATSGNWEGTGAANTPVFTAGGATTASQDITVATTGSGEVVLNLANVMKTGTVVPAGAEYSATAADDTSVSAATLNLGEGAWSKDSGAFVLRFKGTSSAGSMVVYYVLDLTVEQLPIVEVSTQVNGDDTATGMPGVDDKLQAKGFDADPDDDESLGNVMVNTSTKPDKTGAATAKLTDDDVHFAWVSVPSTETANKATILSRFTVDANGKLTTSTTGYKVMDDNANAKEYTLTAADMDRDFYLIAYAPNTTAAPLATNAEDKAISDVVKTKRTVGVKVSLDGKELPISGSADPEYVIYLVEDGKTFDPDNTDGSTGTWATTWNTTNKWYQTAIDVDNTTYHVYAPSYKGGSNYVDTDLTLGQGVTTTPVVPYWSVAHTTNVAVDNTNDGFAPYLPSSNTTNKADNQVQKALTVAVSDYRNVTTYDKGTVLTTANVPVLEGMNVKVTVDATASSKNTTNNVKKSWSEATDLHTMTTNGWQPGADTSATSTTQTGIAYPTDDGEGNFLIQSADITVTSAKSFSATLKQVRFTVTFVVKDNTPEGTFTGGLTPKIEGATLKTDKTKETATEAASFTATAVSFGTGADGATVTFNNIPAGAFEIVAVGGEKTNVDGYTWNAVGEEALNDPKYPGTIVQVTSDSDVNTHAGNTIQIQYSSNAIRWYDNFNTADGTTLPDPTVEDGPEFVRSSGFEKVDTAGTGPFLALTEGYDASKGDVLTYKVRVENTGANDLEDFRITRASEGLTDLTADLTKVTVYDADGNPKAGTADVTQTGFKLGVGETVEFEVTIPVDQAASSTRYSNVFSVQSSNEGTVAGGNYTPAYQVKPEISFTPGNALVIYGNNEFEPTPTDIAPTWDSDVYDATRFDFYVLSEDDLDDYLDGAARPTNAYTTDGMTGGANKLPDWLVFDATTGAVTFDAALYATDVNVQVKDATSFENYTANEVPDEIVLYIKAVDQRTGVAYYTTYTVNVEPNQLEIVGGDDITLNGIAGNAVNKGDFVYDKVVDEKTQEAIVPTATAPAQNTANGNDPANATSGKVFVTEDGNSVHTATWSVDDTVYRLGVNKHTFTVTYKPEDAAEKWNYKPATKEVPAVVVAPAKSLKFGDSVANAADVIPGDPETDYSEIETAGEEGKIPAAMKLSEETFRHNEGITYLDKEPVYTVKLEKVGDIAGVKLTVENTGFKVYDAAGENELDLTTVTIANTGNVDVVFQLKLDEMAPNTNRWVGQHSFKVTAQGNDGTKATYELTLDVAPKTIPKAHVTGLTDPKLDEHPDKTITVTGENPTDPSKDVELDKWEDVKGNHPITTPKVEIKPEDDPYKPGKTYTTTVTLIPDPNYTFEDKTPEEEAPNYTAGGETPDDGYTVTVTPEKPDAPEKDRNKEVKFEKTVSIPENGVLKFDDKKLDDGTPSATDPAAIAPTDKLNRGVITISKGGKLGKYEINLGAYDNDITDIKVTQTTNTLPAEGLKWELKPTDIDKLEKDGAKTTYTLDMTEVDTNSLNPGTYTLQLTATGTDPNGHTVEATYTLTIRVSSPPAGGGSAPSCPNQVTFLLGLQGTTNDPVMEMVSNNSKVKNVPNVTALEGYQFVGWSRTAPTGDLDKDSKREMVDPKTVSVTGDLTFYAVYQKLYDVPKPPFHEHYVIGYPNGNFGPADNINRASVATIIARAVLPNFVEGANYGNPGGYTDVDGHWAASAIAYCSKYGVFNGYTDGTFKPDQSITRQELALVMARLSGVKHAQEMPFVDMGDAGDWAVDGIYTAYANGWVNGYTDGTFKPLNPIRRDETVKIFNAYLRRGVNEEGLGSLIEYVHSGVASNVTENGTTEYMTWPDVTKDQWAYYEIIEAANDHEFKVDPTVSGGYVVPETWEKCWIDEKWRYHDDLTDGGPTTGLLAAGFRIWSK